MAKEILIIEDEKELRETLSDILELANYNVTSAKNGALGYELIKTKYETFDLIICDINMPLMDGFEVYEKVKNELGDQLPPFVYLSARIQVDDISKGLKLGVTDFFTKPFDVPVLLKDVESILLKSA